MIVDHQQHRLGCCCAAAVSCFACVGRSEAMSPAYCGHMALMWAGVDSTRSTLVSAWLASKGSPLQLHSVMFGSPTTLLLRHGSLFTLATSTHLPSCLLPWVHSPLGFGSHLRLFLIAFTLSLVYSWHWESYISLEYPTAKRARPAPSVSVRECEFNLEWKWQRWTGSGNNYSCTAGRPKKKKTLNI